MKITPRLALIAKNLSPGLTERGKIKIGEKGKTITSRGGKTFQPPQKLDHFRVTTLRRGPDGNFEIDQAVHQLHGQQPKTLPIILLYDEIDLNFQCRYNCFRGRTLWCSGDGELALRMNGAKQEVECPCERQASDYPGEDKCKLNGVLSVIIAGVEGVGGVWKFRTGSHNSVVGILSSLALIKRITGGPLSGIPLEMTLSPKTGINPIDGQTVSVFVVGLEFKGSIQALQDCGVRQALEHATHVERIRQIEDQARKLLESSPVGFDPDPDEPEGENPTAIETKDPAFQDQETDKGSPVNSVPRKRSKSFRWDVDPDQFSIDHISTCGIPPEQLLQLREEMRAQGPLSSVVRGYLKRIGYRELGWLTEREAELLLSLHQSERVVCSQSEEPVMRTFCIDECQELSRWGACPRPATAAEPQSEGEESGAL